MSDKVLFDRDLFLPVSKEDIARRGWEDYDFLIITGDAYVDHPSFGPTIIGRVLEAEGYRVAILAQPDWKTPAAFTALGRPRLAVMISAGNIDSMVAHYTAARKRRHDDAYSPGRKAGLRPDHATVVYSNRIREVYGDIPIIIGGLEASLRRFAHYDYWEDKVRRSILFDAQADILTYGMGESASIEIAARLDSVTPVRDITDVRGTCVATKYPDI
ncbi:MAG: YgiQ family radical SAM protein, partial [Oscillibacter sp.]|nr:YgiQ family radical SAM protein [Oscillibacter sp.]